MYDIRLDPKTRIELIWLLSLLDGFRVLKYPVSFVFVEFLLLPLLFSAHLALPNEPI